MGGVKYSTPVKVDRDFGNDFIPIVEIDADQIGKENSAKKWKYEGFQIHYLLCESTITLSSHIEESKRNQASNAISFEKSKEIVVRFYVRQGNSKATDTDGLLKIKPNGVNSLTKTDFEVKYGTAVALRLSSVNLKENAYIDFYASDDGKGWFDEMGLSDIHCGRIKILSQSKDKDVFSFDEVKKLKADVSTLGLTSTACINVADARISELLDDQQNFMNRNRQKMSHGEYTPRPKYLTSKGFVKGNIKEFRYNLNNGQLFRPKSLKESIKSYIEKEIKNKIGFHVYYISLLNDVHVLTLLINNNNPCSVKFEVFDQGTSWKTNGEEDFAKLDNYFVNSTISLFDWYLKKIEGKDFTRISKIKKL